MDAASPQTSRLLLVAEAFGALAGAVLTALALTCAVTVLVVFALPPRTVRAEIPLEAAAGSDRPAAASGNELLRALEARAIAATIELRHDGEHSFLLLQGVETPDTAEAAVLRTLVASGYRPSVIEFRREIDPLLLLRDPRIVIPALAIQTVVFLVAGAALTRLRVRRRSPPATGARWAATLGTAAGVAAFCVSVGLAWALERLGVPVREQPLLHDLLSGPGGLARLAPWIVLGAPLAEEVFFRGYVFGFLSQRAGFRFALAVSALVFAAAHLNPSGFAIYAVVGAVFAAVYARTGRLAAAVAAHVTYNGATLTAWALLGRG